MQTQAARTAVRAVPVMRKGDRWIYTAASGMEFLARVLTAHRDGSATIETQWAVLDERLGAGYCGFKHRVFPEMLSSKTAGGTSVANLKHKAAAQ